MIPLHHKFITYAVEFLISDLSHPWNHSELAIKAMLSVSCFSRYFKSVVGESFKSFYLRRKMEKAYRLLYYNPDMSVEEVAYKVAYKYHANFTLAFRACFGFSPYDVKSGKVKPQNRLIYKEMKHHIHFEGISLLPDQVVLYNKLYTGYQEDTLLSEFIKLHDFARLKNYTVNRFIGIRHDDPLITSDGRCIYDACVTVDTPEKYYPNYPYNMKTVKECHYATFRYEGLMEDLLPTWNYIVDVWLGKSDYTLKICPWIEIFSLKDQDNKEIVKGKLLLPVETIDNDKWLMING